MAVNPALADPDGTVTLAGTVTLPLLLDRPTENPPIGAAPLSVTVHEEDPGAFTLPGEQDRLFNEGRGERIVIVPPDPDDVIPLPVPLDTIVAETDTGAVVPLVPAAIVKVACATIPFPIGAVFIPYTTQVAEPVPMEH